MVDYYNLLGVAPGASPAEIRQAFRREAKQAHPDAHPHLAGAEKEAIQRRFIQLAHAYEVLSDPARRAEYNRKLARERAAGTGPARPRPAAGGTAAGARRGAASAGPASAGAQRQGAPRPGAGTAGAAGSGRQAAGAGSASARTGAGAGGRGAAEAGPEVEELVREVQDLLGQFGLDMRNQFADMFDKLLDWAMTVFMEVMQGSEPGARATSGARPRPAHPGTGRRRTAGPGRPRPARAGPGRAAPRSRQAEEADLESELAALKQQVRSAERPARAAPPTPESVEEELERIKNQHRRQTR